MSGSRLLRADQILRSGQILRAALGSAEGRRVQPALTAPPQPPPQPAEVRRQSRSGAGCALLLCGALLAGASGCSAPTPPPAQTPPAAADLSLPPAPLPDLAMSPPDLLPPPVPMYLNGSFDGGSSPYQSWVATLTFARELYTKYHRQLRLTYFVTTAFYDPAVTGSAVGKASSRDEVLVRWALTQQAINEGHEIANHTVRHQDGSAWTAAQWRAELSEYQALVTRNLFQPVRDERGVPVFPRFVPAAAAAPGAVGAACTDSSQCAAALPCVMVTPTQGFCTQDCNQAKPCPNGTICGYPQETGEDLDICLPKPAFPVVYKGQELFDAAGSPNLAHPALHPYVPVGFRAPQLATNSAMYDVLKELGYLYDASQVDAPDPPYHYSGVLEFSLMRFPGSLAIPMDYNYMYHMDADGSIMEPDYQRSIISAYNDRGKLPWNIGHHLYHYSHGAYFEVFKRVFRFAAQGCPDEHGALRCPVMDFPSLRELQERYPVK